MIAIVGGLPVVFSTRFFGGKNILGCGWGKFVVLRFGNVVLLFS